MNRVVLLLSVVLITFASCKSSKDTVDNTTQDTELNTREARQRGPGQGGPRGNMEQMFARMDTDGDGVLAKSEVRGRMIERFDSIDLDKDGYITKEEIAKAPRPERNSHERRKQQ